MDDALEQAQQPGALLTGAGILIMVFYGMYAALSVLALLGGCMGSGLAALSLFGDDVGVAVFQLGFQGWVLLFQFIGLIVYGGLVYVGFRVFNAGAAMKELRGLRDVQQASMLAAAGPAVGLIANIILSIFTFSVCGLFLYTVPQILVLGLGAAAAYTSHQVLQQEAIVAQFVD